MTATSEPVATPPESRTFICRGATASGERCNKRTKNADGFCALHRGLADMLLQRGMLHCVDCTMSDCAQREAYPGGVCYYDLTRPSHDIVNINDVVYNLRIQIKDNELIRERLAREMAASEFNRHIHAAYNAISRLIIDEYDRLSDLSGWKAKALGKKAGERTKQMQKLMNRADGKAEAAEADDIEVVNLGEAALGDDWSDDELNGRKPVSDAEPDEISEEEEEDSGK